MHRPININSFLFKLPTKCTYSTWHYSHHFNPTCFGIAMPSSDSTCQS